MKRMFGLTALALGVCIVSMGSTFSADGAGGDKVNDLYPLKVGSVWTYKAPGGQIQVKVEKKENVFGHDCYKLETSAQNKLSATEHVYVEGDGVYRIAVNGIKSDAPVKFLSLSPEKGNKWSVNTSVQGQSVTGEFTTKKEDVTVDAGVYKGATVVESKELKIKDSDASVKTWFAEGVGIVKLEFKLGGQEATLELLKYEPGK